MDALQFNTSITCGDYQEEYQPPNYYWGPSGNNPDPAPAIALGYLFSFGFFGILVVQAFIYYSRFPNDSKFTRYLVWTIMLLEFLNCGFTAYALWEGASNECLACSVAATFVVSDSCGSMAELRPTWSFSALSVLTGILTSLVHAFFCWRIRVISRSLVVPIIVMLISLLQCGMVIWGGLASGALLLFSVGGIIDYLWLGGSLVCDIIITLYTTLLLFRNRSKSHFNPTRSLLSKLIKLTVETGMVTAIGTLLELSLSVGLRPLEHLIVFYSISKLYANCMLASLNSRLVIKGEDATCHKMSTLLFQDVERDESAATSNFTFPPAIPNATSHC